MDVLWTKGKLHKIFSKENIMSHAQASGDRCSAPRQCCRLCGGDKRLRDFGDSYVWEGVEARYDQLLYNCFGYPVTTQDCMICEWCIQQLRNIERFKALVHAAFDKAPSEGSSGLSKRSVEMYDISQNKEYKATPSIVTSQRRTVELLKTKTITEQLAIKKRNCQRRRLQKKPIAFKRTNVACSVCNQRYPMIVPVEGEDTFVCSRCKKNSERSGVCKKCSIAMPVGMMRDHLALHVRADLRGKNRLRCQQNNPSQVKTYSNAIIAKHQCTQCKKEFNDGEALIKHLRFIHGGRSNCVCAICEKNLKSTKLLELHLKEHVDEAIFQCRHCTATFRSKRALQTHSVVHRNILSKSLL